MFGGMDIWWFKTLNYTLSLSAALGLLNMLPVYMLDGSNVLNACWSYMRWNPKALPLEMLKAASTALLILNLALSARSFIL